MFKKTWKKIAKIKKQICTPIWYPKGKKIAQGVEDRANFFQHVKKLLNFWNFVNIKVAKSKLDHLGFYCKLDFFDRTIRKFRN